MDVEVVSKLGNLSKKSPCYDRLERNIALEFERLWKEHLTKWSLYKSQGIDDIYPDGRPIKISGAAYEGTLPQIFWDSRYLPGYMERIFDTCIDIANKSSKEFIIHPNKCYKELETLFFPKIAETYQKMANIDSRLRGDGVNIPQPIDTSGYTTQHQKGIKDRLDHYRLGAFKSLGWRLTQFRGWLAWFVGIILSFIKPN